MGISHVTEGDKLQGLVDAILMLGTTYEPDELFHRLVERACDLVGARFGALGILNADRTALSDFITVGLDHAAIAAIGSPPIGRGVLGLLITDPVALRLDDLSAHDDAYGIPKGHPAMGSFLGVPVFAFGLVYGNLYLTNKIGSAGFTEADQELAEGLALAAGIAIERHRTELHERARRLSDDRDRIARDLHDTVIQRLYAAALTLQAMASRVDDPIVTVAISDTVSQLDATMAELRAAIFDLERSLVESGFSASLVHLIDELAPMLGCVPDLTLSGPLEDVVSAKVIDHALAVVREALTNVAKHAGATHVEVGVVATERLEITVSDNGGGIDTDASERVGHGLVNLERRARRLGGTFVISASRSGTTVLWSVPLKV